MTDIVTQPTHDAAELKAARRGVKHNFADANSLRSAPPNSPMREFWYPVTFASQAKAGESFFVFNEELTIARAPSGAPCAWEVHGEGGRVLPTAVRDGMVQVWGGMGAPTKEMLSEGSLLPPSHYVIHAELVVPDIPVEWGLLVENLLDLAHAPFTHTVRFPFLAAPVSAPPPRDL